MNTYCWKEKVIIQFKYRINVYEKPVGKARRNFPIEISLNIVVRINLARSIGTKKITRKFDTEHIQTR